jgi:hypothetical protein
MKKLILLSLFISGITLKGFSQDANSTTAPNPNAAEIVFENEAHDYGTIKQGANGSYEFKFKNNGKEPLIISNAQGSCGCTVPSWPKEPILPGQGNVIKVTYDTKRVGPFTKTVTLTSNAKTPTKVITIKGVVQEEPQEETFPGKKVESGPFEMK